jgi:hypothetical protein
MFAVKLKRGSCQGKGRDVARERAMNKRGRRKEGRSRTSRSAGAAHGYDKYKAPGQPILYKHSDRSCPAVFFLLFLVVPGFFLVFFFLTYFFLAGQRDTSWSTAKLAKTQYPAITNSGPVSLLVSSAWRGPGTSVWYATAAVTRACSPASHWTGQVEGRAFCALVPVVATGRCQRRQRSCCWNSHRPRLPPITAASSFLEKIKSCPKLLLAPGSLVLSPLCSGRSISFLQHKSITKAHDHSLRGLVSRTLATCNLSQLLVTTARLP